LANEKARALRKRLTSQEVKLWVKLRELKALGFHFRRQAPIGRYIVDFASLSARMVVEVDGGQHGMEAGIRSDRERDAFLRSRGFSVLRFWNSDVDHNLDGVMETILSALNTPTPTGQCRSTLPARGRDEVRDSSRHVLSLPHKVRGRDERSSLSGGRPQGRSGGGDTNTKESLDLHQPIPLFLK
jgi:very-short-patch-repair endonuclease